MINFSFDMSDQMVILTEMTIMDDPLSYAFNITTSWKKGIFLFHVARNFLSRDT